jgi:hypothetical protein
MLEVIMIYAEDRIRTCAGTKPLGPQPSPIDLTMGPPRKRSQLLICFKSF